MIVAQEKTGCYGLSAEVPRPKKERRRKSFPRGPRLALTGMILAFFVIGVMITYYYSQVFALGYRIHKLEKELAKLRVENHSLDGEIRRLSSLDRVEQLAVTRLGMVKPDSNNVLIVTVAGNAGEGQPAGAGQGVEASPGKDEKSPLIRAFTELIDHLENRIWLGLGPATGSEEGRNADHKHYDPEKNNRSFSSVSYGSPRSDFPPGLAPAG